MTGSWKAMPKAKISVMISERYSLTLGSSSMVASPFTPNCWKADRKADQKRHDREIDQQRAQKEENRRRDQIGREGLALVR